MNVAEQQYVDCVTLSFGCNGGNQSAAFKYSKDNFSVLTSDWPYTSGTSGKNYTCTYDSMPKTTIKASSQTAVTVNNVDALKTAVAQQPLTVSIEADQLKFQSYKSGVFDWTGCGTTIDHAVSLVGYGTENGQEYYTMRNSWGTSWGEAGYMKMAIIGDGPGICGVQTGPRWVTTN